MRIAIIAVWIVSATSALAAPQAVWNDGTTRSYWPSIIAWPDGRVTVGANVEQCIEAGLARLETEAEWTAREAAEAQAAQEAAEQAALYVDPQPAVFVPRVSGTLTNVVGESQVFVDDTGEVFAVDETGSPEHTLKQKQAQADARKTIIATAQTAKGKGNKLQDIAERVAALEALNGIK